MRAVLCKTLSTGPGKQDELHDESHDYRSEGAESHTYKASPLQPKQQ